MHEAITSNQEIGAVPDLAAALLAELDDDTLATLADRLADRLVPALVPRLNPSKPPDSWLDVGQAAEHLSCPRSRIYALVSAQRMPHHKDGSRLLFRREELDEWVRAGGGRRP